MAMWHPLVLGILAALPLAGALKAQATSSVPTADLIVVVQDSASQPLAGALVLVQPNGATVLTNAQGRAVFRGLAPDSIQLDVRALGYEPRRLTGVLRAGVAAELTIALQAAPQVLDPLEVRQPRTATRLAEFERRRARGLGVFLDQAAITDRRAIRTADLFLGIPGLTVSASRVGGGGTVTMTRAGGQIGKMAGGCLPLIYLDGALVEGGEQARPGPGVLNELQPEQLAGIEIYRGLSGVPPEYARMDAGCGVILLWTRVAVE